ncbi:MAG: aminotransferase class III-fold pyridoxal phosphate-dependent enzyme [Verrucomicrobiales bacterium]|nr:aminotransferase class III-fold pyridoxal phosphate-dependent enzyme [Verrucomicrobiales bacterium]
MKSFRNRALALFPGGSNGEFGIPPDLIPVIERGEGCRVWDTDQREFLDMTMAWGAALIGHAHPKVLEEATRQARRGANFAALTRRSVELAERLASICPCVERIRFVASGTEATLLCLRVAHAATGRPKVLKFEGAYHGQHPVGVTSLLADGKANFPEPDPSGTGAPWVERDVLVAPFNDLATTEKIVSARAPEIAAVIVEPLHRCIVPRPGFLEGLRSITQRFGIALIFDEVVTGFRLALGGAQEYYGVTPDLVAYGKALGGGFPIGAYGGRAELMEVVSEERLPGPNYAWSASTGGGNPVSAAAAFATLDLLSEKGIFDGLHAAGKKLRGAMADVLRAHGEVAQVLGDGPLAQVAFAGQPITDQRSWLTSDRQRGRALMLELLKRGIFLNPMGTKLYLSLAHDEAAILRFTAALADGLVSTLPLNRTADGPRPQHVPAAAIGIGKSIAFVDCEAAATGDRSRSGSWPQRPSNSGGQDCP